MAKGDHEGRRLGLTVNCFNQINRIRSSKAMKSVKWAFDDAIESAWKFAAAAKFWPALAADDPRSAVRRKRA